MVLMTIYEHLSPIQMYVSAQEASDVGVIVQKVVQATLYRLE